MTNEMHSFLISIQNALHDLAQTGDRTEYDKLQTFIGDKGLEGINLDEIVEKNLI